MAGINPLATASAVFLLCLFGLISGRRTAAPPPIIAGALYSATADTAPASGFTEPSLPPLPQLAVAATSGRDARFPAGTSIVVRFVPPAQSSYTLTLVSRALPRAPKRVRPTKAPSQALAAPPLPPPAPTATAAPVKGQPSPQPESFEDYDDALRRSATTQGINARLAQGDVAFRLTHAGSIGNEGVVRYAIANAGGPDFFVSVVNVYADGTPVPSETAGGYACRGGQEIYGVVHFKAGAVAGKKAAVELVESGGERRRFLLSVDHAF